MGWPGAHRSVGALSGVAGDRWATRPSRKPVPGVLIQGGDTGRWDVQAGGKLFVRDCWYESNWTPFHMFLRGDGRLTLDSFYDAQYTHPTLKGVGVSYAFDHWQGRFLALNIGGAYTKDNPVLSFAGDCAKARFSSSVPGVTRGRLRRKPARAPGSATSTVASAKISHRIRLNCPRTESATCCAMTGRHASNRSAHSA